MKKLICIWLLSVWFLPLFAQQLSTEKIKEMFEETWNTENEIERKQKRQIILDTAPNTSYGLYCKAWFERLEHV